jgi:hypothetical protein
MLKEKSKDLINKNKKFIMNIKPITEKEWIGLTLEEAITKAQEIGYTHRIVEENGTAKMLDYNNKSNRINLRLRNDKVIGAYPG